MKPSLQNNSRWRIGIGALAFATLGGAPLAWAQATPAALAECHGKSSDAERLACYDAVSGRGAAARPTGDAPPRVPAESPARTSPAVSSDSIADAVHRESKVQGSPSMIDAGWDFNPDSPAFDIRFHRANYLLVGRYSTDVNNAPLTPLFEAAGVPQQDLNHTEAKFQISFKTRLWTTDDRRWGAWVGYTQQNQWQVYNGDVSRPFRETNYMPEAFISWKPDIDLGGGFKWNLLNAGYNHQSNGRADVLSRSWDRLFAEFGVEKENLALFGKVWWRLPESSDTDDNPDITRYYGYGELNGLYRWRDNSFALGVRGNVSTGKGAMQFGWTSPKILGAFRGYVQVFSGYGESLIDYNWKQTTVGVGFALSDGL